jgi:hypothetical protein
MCSGGLGSLLFGNNIENACLAFQTTFLDQWYLMPAVNICADFLFFLIEEFWHLRDFLNFGII